MKIEKISDSQIRCTLSKDDLIDRELRLSELAYGTEKAKALFRDMMQQASYEFGFEADDIPLMIEAIPVSPECLVLVITKVEDPDELDTRFSKFATSDSEADDYMNDSDDEGLLDYLSPISDNNNDDDDDTLLDVLPTQEKESTHEKEEVSSPSVAIKANLYKVFSFHSLDEVILASNMLLPLYHGENTLYKDNANHIYYLTIYKADHTPEDYGRICNILSEYGKPEKSTYATVDYLKEYFEPIVQHDAIQILSVM